MDFWHTASNPPPGEMGRWSEEVAVLTQQHTLRQLTYYHGSHGGCWQRLNDMQDGEVPQWWCPLPSSQHRALAEAHAIIQTYRHPDARPPDWDGALDTYADTWLRTYATS